MGDLKVEAKGVGFIEADHGRCIFLFRIGELDFVFLADILFSVQQSLD
jgi:hypothetical protein